MKTIAARVDGADREQAPSMSNAMKTETEDGEDGSGQ